MEREYLDEHEAAETLGRAVLTVQQWRFKKVGPAYFRDSRGGIRYKKEDLIKFMETERVENI
jgi:hypothetical protein